MNRLALVAAFSGSFLLGACTPPAGVPDPAQGLPGASQGPPTAGQPASASLDTVPPCENEDGPGPCRWDAQTAGNGVGMSFTITCDQTFIYDDPEADEMFGGPSDTYPANC